MISEARISLQGPGRPEGETEVLRCAALICSVCSRVAAASGTDDFDVDGGAGGSQLVLQSHFVLSSVGVEAAVHLQVAGQVLLPAETQRDQSEPPVQVCSIIKLHIYTIYTIYIYIAYTPSSISKVYLVLTCVVSVAQ